MKTKTDARLTLSYFRKLERENYLALALVVLLSAAGFCGLLYHIGGVLTPTMSSISCILWFFVAYSWSRAKAFQARVRSSMSNSP